MYLSFVCIELFEKKFYMVCFIFIFGLLFVGLFGVVYWVLCEDIVVMEFGFFGEEVVFWYFWGGVDWDVVDEVVV